MNRRCGYPGLQSSWFAATCRRLLPGPVYAATCRRLLPGTTPERRRPRVDALPRVRKTQDARKGPRQGAVIGLRMPWPKTSRWTSCDTAQREGRVPLAKRGRLVKGAVIEPRMPWPKDVTMDGLRHGGTRSGDRTTNAVAEDVTRDRLRS